MLAASAVLVLARVARPLVAWKIALIVAMAVFLGLTMVFEPLRDYFELVDPPRDTMLMALAVIAATAVLMQPVWVLGDRVVAWGERTFATRSADDSRRLRRGGSGTVRRRRGCRGCPTSSSAIASSACG